ncbi:MAG: hypothetical protein AB7D51_02385 [Desulfovibrionaceae bacterium]|jgi:regulator of replication initiation timing
MDAIAQLETALEGLLERVNTLEAENERLREELATERSGKTEVQARVELLLRKVQEKLS